MSNSFDNLQNLQNTIDNYNLFKEFDWEGFDDLQKTIILKEMELRIYESIFHVNDGDIVVDAGASVGPFIRTILNKKFKKCYAIEPAKSFLEKIKKNTDDRVKIINAGFSDGESDIIAWDNSISKKITFMEFIKEENIDKIDFLKIDCEGGEYEIFKKENFDWLKNNCKYCVGEWHLGSEDLKIKFRKVRDEIFPQFKTVIVKSVCCKDITSHLYTEEFIQIFHEVIIHIEI
jgi:hypothetical protein